MPSHRLERVRELLKREIGEAIRLELPVSEAGLINVNEIELAGDLRAATVFVSILGSPEQQKKGVNLLRARRGRIQGRVARTVILKYTPHLRFVIGDSTASASHRRSIAMLTAAENRVHLSWNFAQPLADKMT